MGIVIGDCVYNETRVIDVFTVQVMIGNSGEWLLGTMMMMLGL